MADEDRFKQSVINILGKRAAFRCSNPDCGAITSGPSQNGNESVNVGEAAHIYGANPGSARHDPSMTSAGRAAISNAIWLCGNCHKIVDDDPNKYPAGLLFQWQRIHENSIARLVGKTAASARERFEKRHLEEFGKISYTAERLIIEKSATWEYLLTAETLNYEMTPIVKRWRALERKLYMKPTQWVSKDQTINWVLIRIAEVQQICHAFDRLINHEFARAWGPPGIPGIDTEIVSTCRLYAEMCGSALAWEESVRFAGFDSDLLSLKDVFEGVAGKILNEAAKLPDFMSGIFSGENPEGNHELKLIITLPEGWNEKLNVVLQDVARTLSK